MQRRRNAFQSNDYMFYYYAISLQPSPVLFSSICCRSTALHQIYLKKTISTTFMMLKVLWLCILATTFAFEAPSKPKVATGNKLDASELICLTARADTQK